MTAMGPISNEQAMQTPSRCSRLGNKIQFDEEAWLNSGDNDISNDDLNVFMADKYTNGALIPRRSNGNSYMEGNTSSNQTPYIESAVSGPPPSSLSRSLEFSQVPLDIGDASGRRSEVADSEDSDVEYLQRRRNSFPIAQEAQESELSKGGSVKKSPTTTHANCARNSSLQQSMVTQSIEPTHSPLEAAIFKFFSEESDYISFNNASCDLSFQDLNKVLTAYYSKKLDNVARMTGHGGRVPLAVLVSLALNDRARVTNQDLRFYHCWSEAPNGTVHAHKVVIVVWRAWTELEKKVWDKLQPRDRSIMTNLVVHPATLDPETMVMSMIVVDAAHRSSEQRVQCEFYVDQDSFDGLKTISRDFICIFTRHQNRSPILMSIRKLYNESRSDRPNAQIAPSIRLETFTDGDKIKNENIVTWFMSTSQHKNKEKIWWSENCLDHDNWVDQILEHFVNEFMQNHEQMLARPYKDLYMQYARSNEIAIPVKGRVRRDKSVPHAVDAKTDDSI